MLYVGEPGEDAIGIWDVATKTHRLVLCPKEARAGSFAFSGDGKRLLTGFDRGSAMIWDIVPRK